MPSHRLRARPPRGEPGPPAVVRDPEVVASVLEDAAHFPGGRSAGVAQPTDEGEVAALLRSGATVLTVGAQSSLTGGATPMGEIVLATRRLNRVLEIGRETVRVQAGVPLTALDAALADVGRYYPPAPTFSGAFVGGTVSTNAAGAATFKYGTTRDWVRALTVVLASGEVLDIERGQTTAHDGGFEIELSDRRVRVPVPAYSMPRVPKSSAGYFAAPGMDLVDLFVGSEGTLGVVTEVTLEVTPNRPATCLAFVPFGDRAAGLAFVRALRDAAAATWRGADPAGLDVSAIEHMDRRCLELLREDGADRLYGVSWPDETVLALLVTLELPPETSAPQAFDEIGRARDIGAPDTPIVRLCRMLDETGVLDVVEIAVPGDHARAAQLLALREAVPAAVNQRVGRAQRDVDRRIEKTAADMIVPFAAFDELLRHYDAAFSGLDAAVWGHVSDGNVHPNIIPRSYSDVAAGKQAILELGRQVIRMGGSPLAEHGVGRNPVKQQLLVELYGAEGVEAMRRVKRALDPDWRLAPGVLFEP
ncbi:MAG: FAD-binding oxidoreductase [Betaproteobacteria bacterium]